MAKRMKKARPEAERHNGGEGARNSTAVFRLTRANGAVVKFQGGLIAMSNEDITRSDGRVIPKATQEQLAFFRATSEFWARHISVENE